MAVVYEEQTLSYGELNRRANQLARDLKESGVERKSGGDLPGEVGGDGGGDSWEC